MTSYLDQRGVNISQFVSNTCVEHNNEPITNFCCFLDCLAPLCPECIDQHNKFHKQQNTFPEIDSIKSVKINCVKKIKAAILALNQEMDKLEAKHFMSPMDMMTVGIDNMRQVRQRAHSIIDNFFDNLEAQYRRLMQELHAKGDDINVVFDNIKKLITDMEYFQNNLEGPNSLTFIKKMIEKAKRDIQQMVEQSAFTSLDVQINDQRIPYIEDELKKFISFNRVSQNKYQHSSDYSQNNYDEFMKYNEITTKDKNYAFHSSANNSVNYSVNYGQKQNQQFNNMLNYQDNLEPYYMQSKQLQQQNYPAYSQGNQQTPQQDLIKGQQHQLHKLSSGQEESIQKLQSPQITQPDFFNVSCKTKFMHFFANLDKKLYIVDIENIKRTGRGVGTQFFQEIHLEINFLIPQYHKSIITPEGTIILTGGTVKDDNNKKSNVVYKFNYSSLGMDQLSPMKFGRSSHSLCYMNGFVYAIGGFLTGPQISGRCEKYDIENDKWTQISSLMQTSSACSACGFNNKFIFKFGGLVNGEILNNSIERYDVANNIWLQIDAKLESFADPIQLQKQFKILSTSSCVQINAAEIFVFGGYGDESQGSRQSFILQNDYITDTNSQNFTIKNINEKQLTHSEGFWQNQAIIYEKTIFCLQNIPNENDSDCLENSRRILSFNSYEWKNYN